MYEREVLTNFGSLKELVFAEIVLNYDSELI